MIWHGYVLLKKTDNLNQENFDTLCAAYGALISANPVLPCYMMQRRNSLDNSMVLYECCFDPMDVEVDSFKQFMADVFDKEPEDIEDAILEDVSYSGDGRETRWWGFNYPSGGAQRLQAARFGRGDIWLVSWLETTAYILANLEDWESPT